MEETEKKRKKYEARMGVLCPKCGGGLRTCFYTVSPGGIRAIKQHAVCPTCIAVYKLHLAEVE